MGFWACFLAWIGVYSAQAQSAWPQKTVRIVVGFPGGSTPDTAARIGTDGRAVIAGRAQPGAKVVLLDGGKEIATGVADARGEWVLLVQDPPLGPNQHELRIVQHVEGQ